MRSFLFFFVFLLSAGLGAGKFPGPKGADEAHRAAVNAKPVCQQTVAVWLVDKAGKIIDLASGVLASNQMILFAQHTAKDKDAACIYVVPGKTVMDDLQMQGLTEAALKQMCQAGQAFKVVDHFAYNHVGDGVAGPPGLVTSGFQKNMQKRFDILQVFIKSYPKDSGGTHRPQDCTSSKKPAIWVDGTVVRLEQAAQAAGYKSVANAAAAAAAAAAFGGQSGEGAFKDSLVEQPDIAFGWLEGPVPNVVGPFLMDGPALQVKDMKKATKVLMSGYCHNPCNNGGETKVHFFIDKKPVLKQMAVAAPKPIFHESVCGCFGVCFDPKRVNAVTEHLVDDPPATSPPAAAAAAAAKPLPKNKKGRSKKPAAAASAAKAAKAKKPKSSNAGIVDYGYSGAPLSGVIDGQRRVLGVFASLLHVNLKTHFGDVLKKYENEPNPERISGLIEMRQAYEWAKTQTTFAVNVAFLVTPTVFEEMRVFQAAHAAPAAES